MESLSFHFEAEIGTVFVSASVLMSVASCSVRMPFLISMSNSGSDASAHRPLVTAAIAATAPAPPMIHLLSRFGFFAMSCVELFELY